MADMERRYSRSAIKLFRVLEILFMLGGIIFPVLYILISSVILTNSEIESEFKWLFINLHFLLIVYAAPVVLASLYGLKIVRYERLKYSWERLESKNITNKYYFDLIK